ncbi:hypothetical protein HYFRA_00006004 [Hymenoscyphus fraxineus]|uniref:Uncharacterized protein n=1 Tax=Hymenoscyphus fraxineus TaxID=746836 RepID=A0A9N9KX08_9HELO|nr:hypothetical protein HYFRA_00006004 [Hymenoscyphus fraxineus]
MMRRQTFLVLLLWMASIVYCQLPYDPSPFDITGTINSMSLDAGGPLAGGSITVDGLIITIPQNLLVTLPSITVSWPEMFNNGVSNIPGGISWEANVVGNRVGGKFIAGLVYIAQRSTQTVQGFVTSIDLATGHFQINNGTDCVINDPIGRYGRPYSENPLWQADPDNPSIHTQTGIPMCIPRSSSDPLCPSKNRPLGANGAPLSIFTFKDPSSIGANDPDARLMVPLLVGDYVEVSGTFIGGLLEVNSLNANLQFLTSPGTKPTYLWVEEAIYAVVTTQPGGANGETRAVVWSSDPSTPIQWFAMDVDACSGDVTERNLNLMQPTSGGPPLGRAVYRPGKTDVSPATRQVGFRVSSGVMTTSNNITAGQYIQPIFSYTFPELTAFGTPMFPNLFDVMPYLAQGSGPYTPGTFGRPAPSTEVIVGQLSPWPGASAPSTTSCAPKPTLPPTTLSTTATSSVPASTKVAVPKDTITILSASQSSLRGVITVTASASSNNPDAKLTMSVQGPNPISSTAMTQSGNTFSLSVSVKSKGTSVTITSQFGGSATLAIK